MSFSSDDYGGSGQGFTALVDQMMNYLDSAGCTQHDREELSLYAVDDCSGKTFEECKPFLNARFNITEKKTEEKTVQSEVVAEMSADYPVQIRKEANKSFTCVMTRNGVTRSMVLATPGVCLWDKSPARAPSFEIHPCTSRDPDFKLSVSSDLTAILYRAQNENFVIVMIDKHNRLIAAVQPAVKLSQIVKVKTTTFSNIYPVTATVDFTATVEDTGASYEFQANPFGVKCCGSKEVNEPPLPFVATCDGACGTSSWSLSCGLLGGVGYVQLRHVDGDSTKSEFHSLCNTEPSGPNTDGEYFTEADKDFEDKVEFGNLVGIGAARLGSIMLLSNPVTLLAAVGVNRFGHCIIEVMACGESYVDSTFTKKIAGIAPPHLPQPGTPVRVRTDENTQRFEVYLGEHMVAQAVYRQETYSDCGSKAVKIVIVPRPLSHILREQVNGFRDEVKALREREAILEAEVQALKSNLGK